MATALMPYAVVWKEGRMPTGNFKLLMCYQSRKIGLNCTYVVFNNPLSKKTKKMCIFIRKACNKRGQMRIKLAKPLRGGYLAMQIPCRVQIYGHVARSAKYSGLAAP